MYKSTELRSVSNLHVICNPLMTIIYLIIARLPSARENSIVTKVITLYHIPLSLLMAAISKILCERKCRVKNEYD